MTFEVKDSGVRESFSGGMVRDTEAGKTRFDLVPDGPMFQRWAEHLTKGAEKYSARNWMLAAGDVEIARFRTSAFRHFMQWWYGETDEDHAAAVYFNINGAEYVRERLGGCSGCECDPATCPDARRKGKALASAIEAMDDPSYPARCV